MVCTLWARQIKSGFSATFVTIMAFPLCLWNVPHHFPFDGCTVCWSKNPLRQKAVSSPELRVSLGFIQMCQQSPSQGFHFILKWKYSTSVVLSPIPFGKCTDAGQRLQAKPSQAKEWEKGRWIHNRAVGSRRGSACSIIFRVRLAPYAKGLGIFTAINFQPFPACQELNVKGGIRLLRQNIIGRARFASPGGYEKVLAWIYFIF